MRGTYKKMRGLPKKGEHGNAGLYISRARAMKLLQLPLKHFRRLCILKGIYPMEPTHKRAARKSSNTTYYHKKDISHLSREPLIEKFRLHKSFMKHLKKAIGKKDQETRDRIKGKGPNFKVDHIVKERYPTFIDAVRDIDDAISICYLFSTFPRNCTLSPELIHLCRRVIVEFLHYVIASRSLRKVFISIKGFYYQAEIMGQLVTWVTPHNLGFSKEADLDFKVMLSFADFYSTMLGFINYKLFSSINLIYPPKISAGSLENVEDNYGEDEEAEYVAPLSMSLRAALESVVEDEVQVDDFNEEVDDAQLNQAREAELKKEYLKKLFENCKIYLNREVPRESLVFIIRCFGGEVSFDETVGYGATFTESDETITHQIIDRPMLEKSYLNRFYVQPQWAYDSVNAGMLLPVEMYFPGVKLPPHLSPFVEEKEGDYIPPERQALINMQKGITQGLRQAENDDDSMSSEDSDGDMDKDEKDTKLSRKERRRNIDKTSETNVTEGILRKENVSQISEREAAEEKRLAIMMMPKKKRHLYDKIIFGRKRKNREVLQLKAKREEYDRAQKRHDRRKRLERDGAQQRKKQKTHA